MAQNSDPKPPLRQIRDGVQATRHGLGERFDQTNARLDQANARLDQTNARLERTRTDLLGKLDQTNARLDQTRTDLLGRLDQTKVRIDDTNGRLTHLTGLVAKSVDEVAPPIVDRESARDERVSELCRRVERLEARVDE